MLKTYPSIDRRDMIPLFKWVLWFIAMPEEIRPCFLILIDASYTSHEVRTLKRETELSFCEATGTLIGLKAIRTRGN